MKSKNECKGCNISKYVNAYRILESNELSAVNYCNEPVVLGHLIVQPQRHVEKLTDLRADEMADITRLIWKYSKVLLSAIKPKPKKIYLCTFNESPDWHLHFHLVPRNDNIPEDKRGAQIFSRKVPTKEKSSETVRQTISKIRMNLTQNRMRAT